MSASEIDFRENYERSSLFVRKLNACKIKHSFSVAFSLCLFFNHFLFFSVVCFQHLHSSRRKIIHHLEKGTDSSLYYSVCSETTILDAAKEVQTILQSVGRIKSTFVMSPDNKRYNDVLIPTMLQLLILWKSEHWFSYSTWPILYGLSQIDLFWSI